MPKSLPKSGCACVAAPIVATHADDLPFTGNVDTLACHTLSAGKIPHFCCTGGEALELGAGAGDDEGTGEPGPAGGPDSAGNAVAVGWAEHDDSRSTAERPMTIRRTR